MRSSMVLPGVQALFGFQLVAVYNAPFEKLLTPGEQRLHLVGLFASAVALLMTPAAYQRQAEPHQISERVVRFSTLLLTTGRFVLMQAVQVNCYLIARIILQQQLPSALLAIGLELLCTGLWFVLSRLWRLPAKRTSCLPTTLTSDGEAVCIPRDPGSKCPNVVSVESSPSPKRNRWLARSHRWRPSPAISVSGDCQPSTGALMGSSHKTSGSAGHRRTSPFLSPSSLAVYSFVGDRLLLH